MQLAIARKLGAELVAAGVLSDFVAEGHGAGGLRRTHGTSTISGHWAERPGRPPRRCSIVCEDVARALVAAQGWTVDAIQGCSHRIVTALPWWTDKVPWPNRIKPDRAFRKAPVWRPSRVSVAATESTRRKASVMSVPDATLKCCTHSEGVHRPRSKNLQAYCTSCKGGKATHEYRAPAAPVKSVTPAATSAKPKLKLVPRSATPKAAAAARGSRKDPALCELKGCTEPSRRRGMCRHHYRAWLKTDRAVAAS